MKYHSSAGGKGGENRREREAADAEYKISLCQFSRAWRGSVEHDTIPSAPGSVLGSTLHLPSFVFLLPCGTDHNCSDVNVVTNLMPIFLTRAPAPGGDGPACAGPCSRTQV